MDMLMENYGFARILTVLARGYLFYNPDGTRKDGDPYERVDFARRALCAWCSIPDKKNAAPKAEWQFKTDFRERQVSFPSLWTRTDVDGIYGICMVLWTSLTPNRDKVDKSTHKLADNIEKLEDAWRRKVI